MLASTGLARTGDGQGTGWLPVMIVAPSVAQDQDAVQELVNSLDTSAGLDSLVMSRSSRMLLWNNRNRLNTKY